MRLCKFSVLVVAVVCGVGGASGAPTVCLDGQNQCLQGVMWTSPEGTRYDAFLGVPFAKAPIGQLRLANPVPYEPWSGTYDASHAKTPCVQENLYNIGGYGLVFGSEDCLYLNIYRPKVITEPLPVMIYIHEGQFSYGLGTPEFVGPDKFMDTGNVILVVLQHRLGVLGFLSTGDGEIPGNFGLKDQAMAIKWVRKHIHRFGGKKERITLFGADAGAAATQLHMMSPLSRGLFSRAILISGSALSYWAEPKPKNDSLYVAREQIAALGHEGVDKLTGGEIRKILRGVDANVLVASGTILQQRLGIAYQQYIFRPVIEEYVANQSFLSDSPITLWESGEYEQIPMMIGHVPNEGIVYSALAIKLMQGDPQTWSQVSAQMPALVTNALMLDSSEAPLIKKRFFPQSTNSDWVTPNNVNRLEDLVTEAGFLYPSLRAIRSHLQHANYYSAPVSLYYFNFTGPYSTSRYYVPNIPGDYGICHMDDLTYLFNEPVLFPPFPKRSPAWTMSKKFVELFVNFAYFGITGADLNGSCQSYDNCRAVMFYNTDNARRPVGIRHVDVFNTELLAFWHLLYTK